MSRVIKFRGQTRRKGEYLVNMAGDKCNSNWVYGGIFPQNNGGDFAIIYQQKPEMEKFPVYADTVGQYIGKEDKNGKEIYEGDIVRHISTHLYGVVRYSDRYLQFVVDDIRSGEQDCSEFMNEVEKIGNIFDNPELLKEVVENDNTTNQKAMV